MVHRLKGVKKGLIKSIVARGTVKLGTWLVQLIFSLDTQYGEEIISLLCMEVSQPVKLWT